MNYQISHPNGIIDGEITIPASKSISNRVLIIRELCKQKFQITNLSDSNDTKVLDHALKHNLNEVNIEDSGSAMRFLTALLAIKKNKSTIINGTAYMEKRPIGILVDGLIKLGAEIQYLKKPGFPPLKINGRNLMGGEIDIDAQISSQFISALLLIAPILKKGLILNLKNCIVSKPYINMTLELMNRFGIQYSWIKDQITISPQKYMARDIQIEQDWSAVSFWCEIATLAKKINLKLNNLSLKSIQGDRKGIKLFQSINFEKYESGLHIKQDNYIEYKEVINCIEFPDLSIPLIITTSIMQKRSVFKGLETLIIKESNRIEALKKEMSKYGVYLEEKDNQVFIKSDKLSPPNKIFNTYNDHRIAMSIAPLALKFPYIIINNIDVVKKSYPNFWNDLEKVGFIISPLTDLNS
ncbi:MAG: 3-phosphoshikimate 1-carboxyvinyltransferase [Bacteroidota bacterium]|nr:3-phosphoshikimate 1-carboxyvinyltransferase [Bacteroidota bacterium]